MRLKGSLERPVFAIGVGMVPFSRHRDLLAEDLGREAVRSAVLDAGVAPATIEEIFCGTGYGGSGMGQRILRDLGMTGPPITNVENACSSGASAVRLAVTAVSSGRVDVALAVGVDHLGSLGGGTLPLTRSDVEVGMGLVAPAIYAMRARRYLHETGRDSTDLAQVAVKARRHGALNPYAHLRATSSMDEVLGSRMIADPLRLLMCCPTSDGAAAVVVASRPGPVRSDDVRVLASVLCSGVVEDTPADLAWSETTHRAAGAAWEASSLGPADVSVAEVHDAFAISELMYYEALGFCGRGEAMSLIEHGETSLGGSIPVNPGGGLLCRGHPVGATGVAQACEIVWQLRGEAGDRQVDGARVGLTHTTGGGVSGLDHIACAIHVFAR